MESALAALDLSQSEFDREQCAATHGENDQTLRRCLAQREGARKAQLDDLREALRERRLRTGQTSCNNPVTGATGLCQET